ncbi:heparan-alpha-glucosaminide N-acetyltransferase domain-containing protein [Brachybacterium endophyticum]|nr:heparan-alpha-glucosaminide N-acetyltransferase domain-containing protein [Brachybacterium endophyticum]
MARIESLDLARLLAILGMMASHLLVPVTMSRGGPAWQMLSARIASVLAEGTSATLFAVIGGCSMVLASRQRLAQGDRVGAVRSAVTRGALVVVIGLALGFVPTWVTVVLVPFGVGMMLTAPLLLCSSRILLAVAALLTAVGGWLNATVRSRLDVVQEIGNVTPLDVAQPFTLLRGLALTGMYPLITWLPFLLLGVVLMRSLLGAITEGRTRRWATIASCIGAGVAALAYGASAVTRSWALGQGVDRMLLDLHGFGAPVRRDPWVQLLASPHTGSIADMVATAGVAVAVIGLLTLMVPPTRQLTRTLPRALRSAGAAPLSIYTLHVLLTGVAMMLALVLAGPDAFEAAPWYVAGIGILAIHLVIVLGVGALLSARGSRGPLEALVSGIARRAGGPRTRPTTPRRS